MNEKERMINGKMYSAADKDLEQDRFRAKDLCLKYNLIPASKVVERKEIIRQLFGKVGENFNIESNFYCDYGYNIEAGNHFYMNHNCTILDCAKVTFGSNVLIAPNCGFYTAGHPLDVEQRNKWLEFAYPITVGNNVWIGGSVCVLPNVTIGDSTVIGAGSVVNKDIPEGVIAAGNPCRVIRKITKEDALKYGIYGE